MKRLLDGLAFLKSRAQRGWLRILFAHRYLLIPIGLIGGLSAGVALVTASKSGHALYRSLARNSANPNGVGAFFANSHVITTLLIALATGLGLYLYIDYQQHKRPLKAELANVKYSFLHHVRLVSLPLLRYNWRIIGYTLGVGTTAIVMMVTAFSLSSSIYAYNANEFVTTWKTNNPGVSASNQITIPTSGVGYNYTVDWGDSSTSSSLTGDATHTYASPGTYTVKITGTFPRINFDNTGDKLKILTVEQWGSNPWTSMQNAFSGAANLTIPAIDAPVLSGATSLANMFDGATSFNQPVNSWDVSSITNFNSMFRGASSFNQPLSSWDTSSATNIGAMFNNASAFNQSLNSWDVSSVTNMRGTFRGAFVFDQPLNSWDVSSVTDMSFMFADAKAFNQPLNSWITTSLTNLNATFANAITFNQPLSNWNVSNVTNMSFSFASTNSFDQPLNNWDTSSVTDISTMFGSTLGGNFSSLSDYRSAFNQSLNSWDVSNVTNMNAVFASAHLFNGNISAWNTSSVIRMDYMFYQASSFNQAIVGWNVANVTNMEAMFNGDTAFEQSLANWNVANVTNMGFMFGNGSGLSSANYDATLTGWSILTLKNNVQFGGGDATYCTATAARSTIIALYNWSISDGGQNCPANTTDFITTWDTNNPGTSNSNQITIPIVAGSATIDWGDGNTTSGATTAITHTYATPGVYSVAITSTTLGISFNQGGDTKKILTVEQWGDTQWTYLAGGFSGASNLTIPASDTPNLTAITSLDGLFIAASAMNSPLNDWDVSNVTSMTSIFAGATSFNQPLDQWDVSSVTDLTYAFLGATSFNANISSWNVSNVTSMTSMFADATSFNQPIGSWNVGSVTNMQGMFSGATSFNQNINSWDTSAVTNASGMFNYALSFDQPLNSWNMGSVTDMNAMFQDAQVFNQNINSWDVSNVTNMSGMFGGALLFDQPLDQWNVGQVTNMAVMFGSAASFNQDIHVWNVSSVTDFSGMFYYAIDFDQPLNSWDTSSATTMSTMFNESQSFNQPLDLWDVSNVTTMDGMFNGAISFDQTLGFWDVSNVTDMTEMFGPHLFQATNGLSVDNYDSTIFGWSMLTLRPNVVFDGGTSHYCLVEAERTAILTNFSWTIYDQGLNCAPSPSSAFITTWKTDNQGATNNNQIRLPISGTYSVEWGDDTSSTNITNATTHTYPTPGTYQVKVYATSVGFGFSTMLADDSDKILAVDQWGSNKWQSLSNAFAGAANLTIPATDAPDLSEITSLSGMFFEATSMNSDINNWDVSSVTNMSSMFNQATSYNKPLSNWDVSSVTNMDYMFYGSAMNEPLNNWDVSSVISMDSMFAFSPYNQPLNNWDVSSVTNMYRMFDTNVVFNQPLNNWNTSSVTNISGMFAKAHFFNQPLNNWDVSSVISMDGTFAEADTFNQPLDNWNTSSVTRMDSMFYAASDFNGNVSTWNTSNVTNMSNMFFYTLAFDQPLNNWNTSSVQHMEGMFATSLFNQPLNNWDVSSVISMESMFYQNYYFNQPLDNWNVSSVTSMNGMFSYSYSFNQPLDNWNTSSVTNMNNMFDGAVGFDQTLGFWDISNVTTMSGMFGPSQGLSVENYDTTLTGWAAEALQSNVPFSAGNSNYCLSEADRASIISTYNWTITDGGLRCPGFVTTWKTDNPGDIPTNQITIPTVGSGYDYSVDWGDGNTDTHQTSNASHTYATPGTYSIRVTGTFPRIYMPASTIPDRLLSIDQWGDNQWTSMNSAFMDASNLTISATDTPDLSNVADMRYMFSGATSLDADINNWDVSSVNVMTGLFDGATSFNSPLSLWNVSSVTDMSYMFRGSSVFNRSLDQWDVSSVYNMQYMFQDAASFNGSVENWDTSSLALTTAMFQRATSFNQSVYFWDVSHVSDMAFMFASDIGLGMSFNQPLDQWDVSSASNMSYMFSNATSFNQPLATWNTASLYSSAYMFFGATSFNQSLGFWDMPDNANTAGMFGQGSALDISNYDSTLIGWSSQTLQTGNTFDAGGSQYCAADTQRASILTNFSWTINDAGDACPPTTDPYDEPIDFSIHKTLSNIGEINSGDTVTYHFAVTNEDADANRESVIYDLLPTEFTFESFTTPEEGVVECFDAGTGESVSQDAGEYWAQYGQNHLMACDISGGLLEAGESLEFDVVGTASSDFVSGQTANKSFMFSDQVSSDAFTSAYDAGQDMFTIDTNDVSIVTYTFVAPTPIPSPSPSPTPSPSPSPSPSPTPSPSPSPTPSPSPSPSPSPTPSPSPSPTPSPSPSPSNTEVRGDEIVVRATANKIGILPVFVQKLLRKISDPVAKTISWLLLLILLAIALLYGWRARNEYLIRKELEKALARLQGTKNAVKTYLSLTNHYLNTPFAIMSGATELLATQKKLSDETITQLQAKLGAYSKTANAVNATSQMTTPEANHSSERILKYFGPNSTMSERAVAMPITIVALIFLLVSFLFSNAQIYSLNFVQFLLQCLCLILGALLILFAYHNHLVQTAAQEVATNAIEQSAALLDSTNAFIKKAADELKNHFESISQTITPFISVPETRSFLGGLAMLKDMSASLGKVSQFSLMDTSSEALNLSQALPALLGDQQATAAAKHVYISLDVPSDINVPLYSSELQQLVQSTVNNAIEHSPENGTVTLRAHQDRHGVTLQIIDQGSGIPEETQHHLFESFYKVEGAETYNHEGLGLNLHIDKIITEKHGGVVEVQSGANGTSISFTLPASNSNTANAHVN